MTWRKYFYLVAISLIATIIPMTVISSWNAASAPARPRSDAPGIMHPVERVFYTDDWRYLTSREYRRGEIAFVVLRTGDDLCAPIGGDIADVTFWQMLPLRVDVPSTRGAQTGTFYEALVPRNERNCALSRYVLAEWQVTGSGEKQFQVNGTTLGARVSIHERPRQGRPFYVGMSNFGLTKAYCDDPRTCKRQAELGHLFAKMLQIHGIQVMQNWVRFPPIKAGKLDLDFGASFGFSFRQLVMNYAGEGYVGFPRAHYYSDREAYLRALEKTVLEEGLSGRAWVYASDEPKNIDKLADELRAYRSLAPSVQVMVTTDYDVRLDGLVDIFSPVFNRLVPDHNKTSGDIYRGRGLWTYLSCMGACGPNRRAHPDAPKKSGPPTGLPDLLIDRTAGDLFKFFKISADIGVDAGIYFEAVESYPLIRKGVDPFVDTWNFGGNGHGLLIFPGRAGEYGLSNDQPLPSFRLKLIRHAMQTYW